MKTAFHRTLVAVAAVSVLTTGLFAQAAAPTQLQPKADVVMTEELMARLIKYTWANKATGTVDVSLGKILDIWAGPADMPYRNSISDAAPRKHYFGFNPDTGARDILIIVIRDGILEAYLTDKTAKLRAAAISDDNVPHLITNEKAAEKFKAELALFAKEAAEQLPPTEPAAPDKK